MCSRTWRGSSFATLNDVEDLERWGVPQEVEYTRGVDLVHPSQVQVGELRQSVSRDEEKALQQHCLEGWKRYWKV